MTSSGVRLRVLPRDEKSGVGESGRAEKTVFAAFPEEVEESVLIQSTKRRATDPGFKAAVADIATRLQATKGVTAVVSPDASGKAAPVSPESSSAWIWRQPSFRD